MNVALISSPHGKPAQEYVLSGTVVTIGRGDANDIVLQSAGTSRDHARITWTGSSYVIEDVRSKNGTWLNDQRVEAAAPLRDGDVIRFGEAEYVFRLQEDATITLPPPTTRETVTVMFTDLQGHTPMFEQVGAEAAFKHLDEYLSSMSDDVVRFGGRTVKTLGDGLIGSFFSVRQTVDCAIAIQRTIVDLERRAGARATPVRIGIDSGEAMKQGDDLIGLVVVKASRIMSSARGGQIFLSEISRRLLGPATGVKIASTGWHELDGISRKERLFEVLWR